jgi:hypothetical protein
LTTPLKLGELPIVLWLLIRGARPLAPSNPNPEVAGA